MKVKFHGETCTIKLGKYGNGRPALQLFDEDNIPFATATVNLVDYEMPGDCVAIKDYNENQGMFAALLDQDIINGIVDIYQCEYVSIPICTLSDKMLEFIKNERVEA